MDSISGQSCNLCGSTVDLYESTCKHMTFCLSCGKSVAGYMCRHCDIRITRLIREYNVRVSSNTDTNYCIGRFIDGLPDFNKNENTWISQKGAEDKRLLLEEETSHLQYIGVPHGSMSGYQLLLLQEKEFVAVPISRWYTFTKNVPRKQVTSNEAGVKMKTSAVDGNKRWMKKLSDREAAAVGRRWRRSTIGDDEEAKVSDRGEEDDDGPRGVDLQDYDMEMGDDDMELDDKPVGDPDRQEDLVTGTSAPAAFE